MTFEGDPKAIPVKGIMRAGADSVIEDGAMNEVIGLEYKEGSYVPYSGVLSGRGVPNWATNIYIHKTSTQNNIIVKTESELLWMSEERFNTTDDIGDYGEWEMMCSAKVKDVEFIGNILCVSTNNTLKYYLFQDGEYKDWTIDKNNLPRVSFRVGLGLNNQEVTDTFGDKQVVGLSHSKTLETTNWKQDAESMIIACRGRAEEEGALTGYFIVCAAYRLTTGEYIKASNPIVMCRPMHKYSDSFYNVVEGSTNFTLKDDSGSTIDASPKIGDSSTIVKYSKGSAILEEYDYLTEYTGPEGAFDPENVLMIFKDDKVYKSTSVHYPVMSCTASELSSGKYSFCAIVSTNKLQYLINKDIDVNEDLIDSLCIFISQEIDPYIDINSDIIGEKSTHGASVRYENLYYRMCSARLKPIEEVIEELNNVKNLYLVSEIEYKDIKSGEDWMDIELKGLLGSTLVTRTTLPISAFDYSVICDANLDTYNSRLHIYNYNQEEQCGYDIEDFNLYGGFGQHQPQATIQFAEAYVIADVKSSTGNIRVVKHFDHPSITSSSGYPIVIPSVSFHMGEARSLVLIYRKENRSDFLVSTYTLKKTNYGGFAWKLSKDLNPMANLSTVQDVSNYINGFNSTAQKDYMRVSDTYIPYSLPYANTYTIGNGYIVGLATLSITLSQDTFGQYPLLVFCTDGIYSMGVDTTGAGVYSNIAPFSREVCVNPNSICEIDGAVLFASSKGLMMATAQGVDAFLPMMNGVPKHRPQTDKNAYGLGLVTYHDCISNEQITRLWSCIDDMDFRNYIADQSTYITYASEKNKIVVYNGNEPYIYWIDIPTRNVTKLPVSIKLDNNDYPTELYVKSNNTMMEFKQLSANVDTPTMFQTRPIKLEGGFKSGLRVVVRGYFKSDIEDKWAALVVLGSYDGVNWQPIGIQQKPVNKGFHDIGCNTDRVSHKYMMIIFSASLNRDSHIDGIELTKYNKYNNKLK